MGSLESVSTCGCGQTVSGIGGTRTGAKFRSSSGGQVGAEDGSGRADLATTHASGRSDTGVVQLERVEGRRHGGREASRREAADGWVG